MRATFAPASGEERIHTIDILRGVALFGILQVNFSGSGGTRTVDQLAKFLVDFFFGGKFYPLYSFLFGLGFGVMLLRATDRGARLVPAYLRRLLVLGCIGVAHLVFIWFGDILWVYAVLGVFLILFRHRSPRFLLAAAAVALVLSAFDSWHSVGDATLWRPDPQLGDLRMMQAAAAQEAAIEHGFAREWAESAGTYLDLVAIRVRELKSPLDIVSTYWLDVFAMFLLGLYAAKRRLFENLQAHRALAWRVLLVGSVAGIAGNFVLFGVPELVSRGIDLIPELPGLAMTALWKLSGPPLSLAYIAGVALLCQQAGARRWLSVLAPAGRMGLTNYLLQSLVGTTLYYGYGFGLQGKVGFALGVALCTIIFACQVAFSHWWMARFRFGPVEWLWRSLTYWRRQPMRLREVIPVATPLPVPSGTS